MTDLDELRALADRHRVTAAKSGEETAWASSFHGQYDHGFYQSARTGATFAAYHARLSLALTDAADEIDKLRTLLDYARDIRLARDERERARRLETFWATLDLYDAQEEQP